MNVKTIQLLEIVRFEVVNQFRRKSLWIFFILFLFPLIGITSDRLLDARSGEVAFNAPIFLAQNSIIMSVIALLLVAVVAGDTATRDVQTGMEPLLHAAPLHRAAYIAGRLAGAFLVVTILLTVVPLAQLLIPLFDSEAGPQAVGPLRVMAHLEAWFLLIVPNAFVATAVLFSLATLVRHTVGSYAGAVLLFASMQVNLAIIGGRMGRWDLATLLDSTGFTAMSLMSRAWSPIELNQRLIGSGSALLWNRLLWIAIAGAVVAFTAAHFDFGARSSTRRWWTRRRVRHDPATHSDGADMPRIEPRVPIVRHAPARQFGPAARVRQTLAIARDSLRELATPWTLLALPFLAIRTLLTIEAIGSAGAGTMILPTTERVLEPLGDVAPPVVIAIIMFPVVVAGEMLWRERDANMHALADSTPVPDAVRFLGKLLGLATVLFGVHLLLMLSAVISQISLGWYELEPALLVQIVFGFELADSLLFALFAFSVHVIANQKHVGHLLVLLLIAAPAMLAEAFVVEHPLLLLGFEPDWRHSPISGYGPFLRPVLAFELYWIAWGLLLALTARLFWVRGVELGPIARVRAARRRFTGRRAGALSAAAALVLLAGGFIFYNTNVLNAYESTANELQRKTRYEQRYARYREAAQPQMTATQLHVEIHPQRREADVRGVHRLENRTKQPIGVVHVALSSVVETTAIVFDRAAHPVILDDALGHRSYRLSDPLQPGGSVQMSWQVRHDPRGFPARNISTAVVANGTFFVMRDWMPLIGYQARREVMDPAERKKHGLPERSAVPALRDVAARHDPRGGERVMLDATIGTAADQIAVAAGALKRTWAAGGRRYFHYETSTPIRNEYAIFSARYAVHRSRVGDVAIEILHHPEHDRNVDRIIRSMEVSLAQFSKRFGPYPFEVLRMVEYPSHGGSLHAAPGVIWYQERFALFDPVNEPRRIDLPFAVVAHEVAHQFQPVSARVEGVVLLSESFAWYAAMGAIEQEHGTAHLQRFLAFMRETYLTPRSRAGVPLLHASDWFLGYRKGPFAMYALREYIGQEAVDLAWRRLRAKHASFEPPFATSLDLYRELKEVTPVVLHDLLADLLERNTYWELETKKAVARQVAGGGWEVTLDIGARKIVVDEQGKESVVAMNDLIEVAVFAPATSRSEQPSKTLYRAMHRIRSGTQTITIVVPERPGRAGIDPRHLLIDVATRDNVTNVAMQTAATPGT